MITISAFACVPPFATGLVRELRVRWALEEAGLPYETMLVGQGDKDKPEYRDLQPFGQVPVFQEDGLTLFESGANLLHISERAEALLPRDAAGTARAVQLVFAALNSIEPHAGTSPSWTSSMPRRSGRSFGVRARSRSRRKGWTH